MRRHMGQRENRKSGVLVVGNFSVGVPRLLAVVGATKTVCPKIDKHTPRYREKEMKKLSIWAQKQVQKLREGGGYFLGFEKDARNTRGRRSKQHDRSRARHVSVLKTIKPSPRIESSQLRTEA